MAFTAARKQFSDSRPDLDGYYLNFYDAGRSHSALVTDTGRNPLIEPGMILQTTGTTSIQKGAAYAHQDIYFVFSSFHDRDGNR
jgi:hypothetical protein